MHSASDHKHNFSQRKQIVSRVAASLQAGHPAAVAIAVVAVDMAPGTAPRRPSLKSAVRIMKDKEVQSSGRRGARPGPIPTSCEAHQGCEHAGAHHRRCGVAVLPGRTHVDLAEGTISHESTQRFAEVKYHMTRTHSLHAHTSQSTGEVRGEVGKSVPGPLSRTPLTRCFRSHEIATTT